MRKDAIESLRKTSGEELRVDTMVRFMHQNKAYQFNLTKNKNDNEELLQKLKEDYQRYRKDWKEQPKKIIKDKFTNHEIKKENIFPLCIDIETAAVCDLACPHCYRQFIATPDKIISDDLCYKIIDQAAEMNIPSIKFNWRGEPLLHPKLSDFIKYAKKKGILETIINTNATKLNTKISKNLIEAGLDILIFSFDGGSKKTYEKLRPGRFKKNNFDDVYLNIKNFKSVRESLNSVLPITKVQMVLTEETHEEQDSFFNLFNEYVDDVSVKQYTERGGELDHLKDELIKTKKIDKSLKNNELLRDQKGNLFISEGRLPCEQPYQRMLATYDGKVSMCCYDWGSMHPIGYIDKLAFEDGKAEYLKVKKQIENKKKGFEMMKPILPEDFNSPIEKVSDLNEIWIGNEMKKVREKHMVNEVDKVKICKKCPFKETYSWKKID
jgi:MoaA/NifB/PqqE/SkfB family radical SAM enzyme